MATDGSAFDQLLFLSHETGEWRELRPDGSGEPDDDKRRQLLASAASAREELKAALLSSLQMQHVAALAGSGTSLGPANGPSMGALWDHCVGGEPLAGETGRIPTPRAVEVIGAIGYEIARDGPNIEALLSRCEAYLQVRDDANVASFVSDSRRTILEMCSAFLDAPGCDLAAHRTFLHRLSRRRARDSRMRLFTTNYDLCFERAASMQGLVVLDGFSFSLPRTFDPRFFLYDIVRRPPTGDDAGTPLEGVFQLMKLHGSVDWERSESGAVQSEPSPAPEAACLVYPAKGKYQQSYIQPHLELMSQYLAALREPNTCLIVAGFGFNDDHLSEPIVAAIQTNPHLRVVVVDPTSCDIALGRREANRHWKALLNLAKRGEDVWLVNAKFGDFAEMIPDLKALNPAQRLARDIASLASRP